MELTQDTCDWAFDFNGDLIGLYIGDCFIEIDPLSFLFGELSDCAFVDGVG